MPTVIEGMGFFFISIIWKNLNLQAKKDLKHRELTGPSNMPSLFAIQHTCLGQCKKNKLKLKDRYPNIVSRCQIIEHLGVLRQGTK